MGRTEGGRVAERFSEVIARGRASLRRVGRRGLPSGGVVTIEYTPRLDNDPDPGEIVWTWVPFEEDPTQGKDRPVMIIGRRGRMLAIHVAKTSALEMVADKSSNRLVGGVNTMTSSQAEPRSGSAR